MTQLLRRKGDNNTGNFSRSGAGEGEKDPLQLPSTVQRIYLNADDNMLL